MSPSRIIPLAVTVAALAAAAPAHALPAGEPGLGGSGGSVVDVVAQLASERQETLELVLVAMNAEIVARGAELAELDACRLSLRSACDSNKVPVCAPSVPHIDARVAACADAIRQTASDRKATCDRGVRAVATRISRLSAKNEAAIMSRDSVWRKLAELPVIPVGGSIGSIPLMRP